MRPGPGAAVIAITHPIVNAAVDHLIGHNYIRPNGINMLGLLIPYAVRRQITL